MKYLGLMLDESLIWLSHINMLKTKLRRANGLLVKLRHYTSSKLLTTIYNALFESHMRYGCQIWGQTRNQNISDVVKLQKKAVRMINFSDKYTSTRPLFSKLKILSCDEIVNLQNCLLVLNALNKEVPKALQELFKNTINQHYYNTRRGYCNKLNLPQVRTTHYGIQSIKYKSAKAWNAENSDKLNIGYWSKNRLSKSLTKYYFNNGS